MTLEAKTAETFSKTLTPFAVAAIISVVFSWFSPVGIGRVMSPFSSALIGILTLCVFPLVPVLYSASIGRTDLGVSDVTKRVPLYGVGLIGYAIAVVTFRVLDNKLMFVMALAYLCVSLAMCVITLVWKTSAHTAGVAGPVTALVFVFGAGAVPLYALSVFMIWCRVRVHAHTLSQALAGMVVAVAITAAVYFVLYL